MLRGDADMAGQHNPLKRWQKQVAYASLAAVAAWTAFGVYAFWLIVTRNG